MKKILIVLVVLVVLVVAGVGIFVATFNADRYRPLAVEKISQALGRPVELGRLSLVWKQGFALHLETLAVYSDASKQFSSLKVKSADAFVELAPLLQKQLVVRSVVLQSPVVHVEKNSTGQIGLKGISLPEQSSPAGSSGQGQPSDFSFSMKRLQIQDASIHFEDVSAQPPLKVRVENLDLDIKDFSQTSPFSVAAKAGLFNTAQNLSAEARVMLPSGSDPGFAEDIVVATDLSSLNWKQMSESIPALASAGLQGLPKGRVRLVADRVNFGSAMMSDLSAKLELQDGWIKHQSAKSALENIQLSASVKGADLIVDEFTAQFAKGDIKATARSQHFLAQPMTAVRWSSQDLALDELAPTAMDSRAPQLGGRISLDFEGQAAGSAWPQISQSLSGQGQVSLKDGVLLNYNVLREVIQKLSIVPGADEMIKNRLPGIYKAKLNEPSTILKPITLPFVMQNGQMMFSQLALDTDVLAIRGSGQIGLDKTLFAKAIVLLDRDLSAAVAASVPQTQLLLNAAGHLEIPVQIQGHLPQVSVLPDTDYIGSKLLATKAQEIVTGIIQDPEKGVQQVKNLLQGTTSVGTEQVKDTFGRSGNDLLSSLLGEEPQQPQQQPQQ